MDWLTVLAFVLLGCLGLFVLVFGIIDIIEVVVFGWKQCFENRRTLWMKIGD